MTTPHIHTHRNQAFTITLSREGELWHGYAMFDLGWTVEQAAGLPAPDKRQAYLNARQAGRRYAEQAAGTL
ncbi:hypothetical protein QK899_08600 [Pseudomonas sp. AR5]|nr:hypothetical protein QK899_08600 [Pseudomonas sp. AR5]